MKVKFVLNSDRELMLEKGIHLTFNKIYVVYGFRIENSLIDFMIVNDTGSIIPDFYPNSYFEITDNRASKYWVNKLSEYYEPALYSAISSTIISFREVVENKFFFDDLFNGVEKTIAMMKTYIDLFDHESPNPDIKNATIIDGNWIMCNSCDEVWEENSNMGIVVCPKCYAENNNPLWHSEI